jgi:hypothetical protein
VSGHTPEFPGGRTTGRPACGSVTSRSAGELLLAAYLGGGGSGAVKRDSGVSLLSTDTEMATAADRVATSTAGAYSSAPHDANSEQQAGTSDLWRVDCVPPPAGCAGTLCVCTTIPVPWQCCAGSDSPAS